jgi:hypothetical protein
VIYLKQARGGLCWEEEEEGINKCLECETWRIDWGVDSFGPQRFRVASRTTALNAI